MRKISLLMTIILLMASVSFSQELAQPIELTIKSEKTVYNVGDEIWFEFVFKNISDQPVKLLIFEEQFPRYHWFTCMSEQGEEIYCALPEINFKVMHMNKNEILPGQNYVSLVPLHLVEVAEKGKKKSLFNSQPRSVKIQATYTYPDGFDIATSGNEKIFFGGLTSNNTLEINVVSEEMGANKNTKDPMGKEGNQCLIKDECLSIDCSSYDNPVKAGYKPDCVEGVCKCMCYGCK